METTPPKTVNLTTKISEIKMDEFRIEETKSNPKFKLDEFQYEFNVNMGVNVAKHEIEVKLNTNIFSDAEKKSKVAHVNSHGLFHVLNLTDVLKIWEGKVPNIVLANFIGIVLSTTRGFLIDKSQGTSIEGAIIPITNPLSFFPAQPI